ncbi:MAG: hypothetical protein GDA48_10935 [Hormoscilla sp. GM102CHS1]|nr:hypothetical protein [Hormoscilla sp. GM102CHS1]
MLQLHLPTNIEIVHQRNRWRKSNGLLWRGQKSRGSAKDWLTHHREGDKPILLDGSVKI